MRTTIVLTLLTAVLMSTTDRTIAAGKVSDIGTHVTHDEIAARLNALAPKSGTEQIMKMVDAGKMDVGVAIMRRQQGPQSAVVHDSLTEVYYILAGSGVLVTGRDVENPKPMDPQGRVVKELAGPSSSGPSIKNGHSQRFGPGDAIIIPAGVGHWFSSLDSVVDYLVVRIDPERTIPLKE